MMSDLEHQLKELLDKQALHELMVRYCRAVDRGDRELLLSVYHPDAIDDHPGFRGSPVEFADWMGFGELSDPTLRRTIDDGQPHQHRQHALSNEYYVVDGDLAWGETYVGQRAGGSSTNHSYGRYLDHYERRNSEWRVLRRLCTVDWTDPDGPFGHVVLPSLGRSDPSYHVLSKGDPLQGR